MAACSPHFPLAEVQALVRVGFLVIEPPADEGLEELEWDEFDVAECLMALAEQRDFYKSMATKYGVHTGKIQDVYKTLFNGEHLYVKIQIEASIVGFPGEGVAVISFKRDKDYE